ncbi:unnamed protein product [Adineta steineri]|uniref:G-protein coupled receptors family 1 profile domain-containing protein n=1 Tax=Adineta steineri TaxID=433720 RepID=A0A814S5D1_9BILA|nr:unnamed protein product [Adineta steineri]CAF1134841.1 unnamed protein product [Adineta steineri]CAF1141583.1 unnamed protein product [Adineta steineri]
MDTIANETIARYTQLTINMNAFLAPPILILGTIGNLINILIFLRKSLRKNPCSIYFLSASITSLIVLYSGLISRLLGGFNLDLTNWNNILCKMRFYFYYGSVALLSWFIVFASIDRYLSTSHLLYRRSFSRSHVACRLVLSTTVLSILFYGQVFYCFVADPNQFPVQCYSKGAVCRTFNDMQFLIVYSLLPAVLMTIFGCLMINNVHQMGRQIETATNNNLLRRKGILLVPMLLVQIALFVVFTVPLAVSKLYNSLIVLINLQLTSEDIARETFIFNVTVLISYFNCSVGFYIYSLAGSLFRRELKRTIRGIINKTRHQ